MAEPVSIFITAAVLPLVLATIQSSLQLALDAMPEIHDKRNRRAIKKLDALSFKAKKGEFTEKDFEQAKHYYSRIHPYALINENQTLLAHLEKILQLMEGTLVVKNLMEKNHNNPIDSSDIDILHSKIPTWDIGSAMADTFRKHGLPTYEATILSNEPGLIRDSAPASEERKRSGNMKVLEKPAMWCLVAVMPPLLFVPKIRQKC